MDVETYARLNARMLAASIEPRLWVEFLDELSRISDGVKTHIFGYDVACDAKHPLIASGYDDSFVRTYHDHFHSLNEWAYGFVNGNVGQILTSEEMCASERLNKTEFYNDWVRPQEDIRFGGGTILFKERTRFFAIGGNIRSKDGRAKEATFLRTVKLLAPSLRLAFEISRNILTNRLSEGVEHSAGLRGAGDVIILNGYGHVLYVSPSADKLFNKTGLLRFELDSRLTLFDSHADHLLHQTLACLRTNSNFFGTQFCIESTDRTKFNIRMAAFRPSNFDNDELGLLLNIDEPCLVLVITKNTWRNGLSSVLVSSHGFTVAEAEVGELLSEFNSPRKISQMRNSSIHTVRNQIKAGMAKMAVRQRTKYILKLCSIRDRHR